MAIVRRTAYLLAQGRTIDEHVVVCSTCEQDIVARGTAARAAAEFLARGGKVDEVNGELRHVCATCQAGESAHVSAEGAVA